MKYIKIYRDLEAYAEKNGGRMPEPGLCLVLPRTYRKSSIPLYQHFSPPNEEEMMADGRIVRTKTLRDCVFWGGPPGKFTDLRRNILLFMAAIKGELE